MNYAILAATALGAIGLYLMLPRGKATLARLGALLGGMALVGLFLYLLRTVAEGPIAEAGGPPIYFYLFGLIMVAGAVGVITQPKPVYAALYFVLITLAGAGMFVLLLAEFMAIVLIIIYAGAILVTYVFVIMLASQGTTGAVGARVGAAEYDNRASEPFFSTLVAFLLIGAVLQALFPGDGGTIARADVAKQDRLMALNIGVESATQPAVPAGVKEAPPGATGGVVKASLDNPPSGIQVVGVNLYSKYALSLELAGILLTIALVGAVVISRKGESAAHQLGTGNLPGE